ncbi:MULTISPECIES: AVAST type 1 anti-phage system MBL fold metallo-hydrolase Avs1a [unclassified Bacillus (in: firmicutes)]|uniref:AVAST type 1 anti-phage system MBL fold metallo-hydrolase Avs1a n=1 Tax=unclassified Bacillus (in: firmicutes) TaxID=185979 RepID=UPI0008EF0DEE|nr:MULTISPECIES: AVAST type 1 anti-phage system MBL fold metallo-hydrolase Avs1a [unclassified Bacillus (in: firmicutes)]SFA81870.1 Beta-lactamase superfamily domain-containing protein [Bacillus sp. UNCCL13]SFQ71985.1 Beta-lactamase superfamily domain-containing protein [Bacillus sp. cl95]
MSDIRIEVYPALEGDCFLISIGKERKTNILIDGGFAETYNDYLKPRLISMAENGEELNLVIVTHVDADHIEGIIELFKENGTAENPLIIPIKEVWHNSYRHLNSLKQKGKELSSNEEGILSGIISQGSVVQNKKNNNPNKDISAKDGSTLAALLLSRKYKWNSLYDGKAVNCDNNGLIALTEDINLRLLSPNSESLKRLEKYWFKELRKKKYDFKLTDNKLFDDAYEFFLLSQNDDQQNNESENVSYKEKKMSLDHLLSKKMNHDNSPANGSSISFIIEYKKKKLLFLADSHPKSIQKEIQNLVNNIGYNPFFNIIKVSHHGSHRNTSTELLGLIDSPIYLFSTNGEKNNHPNPETIARIISRKGLERKLIFNYPVNNEILSNEDIRTEYQFSLEFSDGYHVKVIDL